VEVKQQKDPPPKNPFSGCHFNIRCEGNIVFDWVNARYFRGFRPEVITLAWCVEQRRELTREEIKKLCGVK
jgi:hypothetical protein